MSADPTGLIDPSLFPFPAAGIDVSGLERAADGLARLGRRAAAATADIAGDWDGLQSGYEAPEQEQAYGLMRPVAAAGEDLDADLAAASGSLADYAHELAAIKPLMKDLEERAQRFRDAVEIGVKAEVAESASWQGALATAADLVGIDRPHHWVIIPWDQDASTSNRNAELLAEHARLVERITTASSECCNAIVCLVPGYSGEEFVPTNAEQLLDPGNPMAWGSPSVGHQNAVEASLNTYIGIARDAVTGGASMLGFDASNDWQHDREFWWQQIGGAVDTVGSMAITGVAHVAAVTSPGTLTSLYQLLSPEQEQWLAERYQVGYQSHFDAIGIDWAAHTAGRDGLWRWRQDWAGTLTETTFNVLSSYIGAGVGGTGVRIGLGWLRRADGTVRFGGAASSLGVWVGDGARWIRTALGRESLDVPARPDIPDLDDSGDVPSVVVRPDGDVDGGAPGRPGEVADGGGSVGDAADEGGSLPGESVPGGQVPGDSVPSDSVSPAEPRLSNDEFGALPPGEAYGYASSEQALTARVFADAAEAVEFGRTEWADIRDVLTEDQIKAVNAYTQQLTSSSGASFEKINSALRAGPPYPAEIVDQIRLIDEALNARPLREAIVVDRAVEFEGGWRLDPPKQLGQVISDEAFMSTSLYGEGITNGAGAILHLRVPEGTPALWVESMSAYAGSERELLLGRGLRWRMDRAVLLDGTWEIFGEVVGP